MRAGYPEVAYELSRTERACVRATLSAASATAANSAGGEEALLKMFRTCSTASITVPSVRGATAEEEMMLVEAMENHGVLLFKARVSFSALFFTTKRQICLYSEEILH